MDTCDRTAEEIESICPESLFDAQTYYYKNLQGKDPKSMGNILAKKHYYDDLEVFFGINEEQYKD